MELKSKIIFSLFALLIAAGCSSTKEVYKTETIVKQDTIKVPVPVVEDTVEAKVDTFFIHGEKIVEQDTVIQVRYYPKEKKIYVKVKPDTVFTTRFDTIRVTHTATVTNEPNFLEKNAWILIAILVLVIIIIAIIKK